MILLARYGKSLNIVQILLESVRKKFRLLKIFVESAKEYYIIIFLFENNGFINSQAQIHQKHS